jgi:chitin disaccharide deacetylase
LLQDPPSRPFDAGVAAGRLRKKKNDNADTTPKSNLPALEEIDITQLQAGYAHGDYSIKGLDSPELRAIHHIGYENVATDRQRVTDLLTDPKIKEAIRKRGIQLIS